MPDTTRHTALTPQETPGGDRVREHTSSTRVAVVDREIEERVSRYVGAPESELTQRIGELEQESDIERVLEANAAALALCGLAAGVLVRREFLVVPVVVSGFLLQHALQGWCPPIPALRRLGVRTRQEIDAEKYALKVLRGDFEGLAERHHPS